jgi:hypothetical protein
MMTITDEKLDALQALCDAANEAPWIWDRGLLMSVPSEQIVAHGDHGDPDVICVEIGDADADFISAARTALPALLAEVRRQRRQIASTNIALAKTQTKLTLERGHFDCLLDQFEAEATTEMMVALADAERRIHHFRRMLDAQEESLAARDQAISDAAAVCAQLRGALAKAEAELDNARALLADVAAREQTALVDLAKVMRKRDEADELAAGMGRERDLAYQLRDEARRLETSARSLLSESEKADAACRADSERTLEAVRAELLRHLRVEKAIEAEEEQRAADDAAIESHIGRKRCCDQDFGGSHYHCACGRVSGFQGCGDVRCDGCGKKFPCGTHRCGSPRCLCTNEPGDSPCPVHDCEHGEHPADCAVCTPPTPFSDALEQAAATGSATLVGPTGTITITREPHCPLHGGDCPTANDPDLTPEEIDP